MTRFPRRRASRNRPRGLTGRGARVYPCFMNSDTCDSLDARRWALWWGVRRSIRYHDRRIVWFDAIHRAGRFLTLLAGGGAAATIIARHEPVATALALSCAAFAALDLAFDLPAKARLHAALKVKFVDIEREINLVGHDRLDDAALLRLCARRSEIERDEPPILRCLDALCHNELCRVDGIDERCPVRWWQRILSHVWYGDPPDPACRPRAA